ncbi:MAG: chorismate mutase [Ktedonobacterales bacterium]
MRCRGIRGAVTASANTAEAIVAATTTLLLRIVERNALTPEDIASVFFTVSDDLDAAYPARAARALGWTDTALLCAREIAVPGGVERCVRVLLHVNTDHAQSELHHVYLGGATRLRPDRAEPVEARENSFPPRVGRVVSILGLGLIGASVGLALRAGGAATEIRGYDERAEVRARALACGAITFASPSAEDAARAADVVILATPISAMRDLLARAGAAAPSSALITDVGSTKRLVMDWARAALPRPERFIGGHPMAGSERSGVEAARADLFAGRVWCLTASTDADLGALERARDLARAVGAAPRLMDPAAHDEAVARVSHLPLVTAAALTLAASQQPGWDNAGALAAGGFRDTTRVASGDPRMARDICLTNREPLLEQIDRLAATLAELRALVASGSPEIEETFAAAKRVRDEWAG